MIMTRAPPLQIVHAEAVEQHGDSPAALRKRGSKSARRKRERLALATKHHIEGQRVARIGEVVAEPPLSARAPRAGRRRRSPNSGPKRDR
jgi:hypothetical protein